MVKAAPLTMVFGGLERAAEAAKPLFRSMGGEINLVGGTVTRLACILRV